MTKTTRLGPVRQWQRQWQATAVELARTGDPAVRLALRQGFVLTREQARRTGCTDADIRRNLYRGLWSAPHRGVVCVLPPGDGTAPDGTRLEVRAAAAALVRPGTAISHRSAAGAEGLPTYGRAKQPELTSPRIPRTADRGGARVYAAALHPDDVRGWYGAAITSPARTVVDLARHGRRCGLIAADAALHEELLTLDEIDAVLRRARRWPGVRKARAVLALACPEVESPLESLCRLLCHDHDVPMPEPQRWVRTDRGWYRVDGLWADRMVILEADGMLKYRETPDDDDPLGEEKLRQEALERAGYLVVRVTWNDVINAPLRTVARIRWALRTGGRGLTSCSA